MTLHDAFQILHRLLRAVGLHLQVFDVVGHRALEHRNEVLRRHVAHIAAAAAPAGSTPMPQAMLRRSGPSSKPERHDGAPNADRLLHGVLKIAPRPRHEEVQVPPVHPRATPNTLEHEPHVGGGNELEDFVQLVVRKVDHPPGGGRGRCGLDDVFLLSKASATRRYVMTPCTMIPRSA